MATEQLYQAIVDTKEGEQLAVTPKMGLAAVEKIAAAVSTAVATGRFPSWSFPTIVPVISNRSY